MIEKSDSKSPLLATDAILGQAPMPGSLSHRRYDVKVSQKPLISSPSIIDLPPFYDFLCDLCAKTPL